MSIAKSLQDRALEAQACYSLGNTYTLLRDYPLAIEYHMRHLRIAQELRDRVGESRAYWSLGNAHSALGNHESALDFANQHLEISKEVGVPRLGRLTQRSFGKMDIARCLDIASKHLEMSGSRHDGVLCSSL